MLDPFHPDCIGVRVPSVLPRETMTYTSFNEITYTSAINATKAIYFANFELASTTRSILVSSTLFVQALLSNVSIEVTGTYSGAAANAGDVEMLLNALPLNLTAPAILASCTSRVD